MRASLVVWDFVSSFLWVWSGALIKVAVFEVLGLGHAPIGEAVKATMSIAVMFFFAFLGKISGGGAYNPITVLASAISGNFNNFLYTVFIRIPAQVMGSICGVQVILYSFPGVGVGPKLTVEMHHGALTEGLLTFTISMISLGLARNIPGNFLMKTWISSVSKLALHVLGSDLTGGCMNPASGFGWAFARGDHITREHMMVYWVAPIQGAVLAVWMFKLLVKPLNGEEKQKLKKSD